MNMIMYALIYRILLLLIIAAMMITLIQQVKRNTKEHGEALPQRCSIVKTKNGVGKHQ